MCSSSLSVRARLYGFWGRWYPAPFPLRLVSCFPLPCPSYPDLRTSPWISWANHPLETWALAGSSYFFALSPDITSLPQIAPLHWVLPWPPSMIWNIFSILHPQPPLFFPMTSVTSILQCYFLHFLCIVCLPSRNVSPTRARIFVCFALFKYPWCLE